MRPLTQSFFRRPSFTRPTLEALECRYAPAVTGSLAGSTLAVSLTAAGDQGAVRVSGTDVQVVDLATSTPVFTTPVSGVTALSGTGNGLASTFLSLEGTLALPGGVTVTGVTTVQQLGSYFVSAGGYAVTASGAIDGGGMVFGNSVNLQAGSGIGAASAFFLTATPALTTSVTQGDAYLANTGDVHLHASGTAMTVRVTGVITGFLQGQSIGILYADALGTPQSHLGMSGTATLAASVGQGGVYLDNQGYLTLGRVGSLTGIVAAGGDIKVSNAPSISSISWTYTLSVTQTVQTGSGDVSLSSVSYFYPAQGIFLKYSAYVVLTGQLLIFPGATVRSLHGNVRLYGQSGFSFQAGSAAQAFGGTLSLVSADLIIPDGSGLTGRPTPSYTVSGPLSLNGYVGSDQGIHATVGGGGLTLNPAPGSGGVITASATGAIDATANPDTPFILTGGNAATLHVHMDGGVSPTISAAAMGNGYEGGLTFLNYLPVLFSGMKDLLPRADLWVTLSANTTTASPGTAVTLVIVVANSGPNAANGVGVLNLCQGLTDVTYISTTTGGATGNTASGAGYVQDYVNLPPGGSVSYTVVGTVLATGGTTLTNAAVIGPPASVFDLNAADDIALTTIGI
jgi:hypothetical protein